MNVDFDIYPATKYVVSQKILLTCFFDSAFKDLGALRKFASNVNVSGAGIDCVRGNQNAFDELVGILMNDIAIFKSAGFGFIRVANQIARFFLIGLEEAPFSPARDPGPAAAS